MSHEFLDKFPNTIIRASAGTGKTFALSNRYLQLLASGVEPETILATTFTRKGAGEILDRIIQRLSGAALDDAAAKKLSTEIGWQLPRQRAANILHELLGNLHRLEISTLDSFFHRVAKVFSLELGLPPNWEIVEQQQIDEVSDDVIQDILRHDSVHDLLNMMSKGEAQRRTASLIRDAVQDIYGIFVEANTREVWDQLPDCPTRLTQTELSQVTAAVRAVEFKKGKQLPEHWEGVRRLVDDGDWEGLVHVKSFQNVLAGIYKFGSSKLPPEIVTIYQKLIPHCRAVVTDRLISQNRSTFELLSRFGNLLEQIKDQTGQLRFDDVANRLLEFVSVWDAENFSFRLDHQIKHLLLDEFQDTSPVQWKVIRPFVRQVTGIDSTRSFFCVGDMKQAIFGWRGGVAEIFDLVDSELPDLEKQSLTKSYRSASPVIDVVNSVFNNLGKFCCEDAVVDDAIHRWPAWFGDHETVHKDLTGYVSFEFGNDCEDADKTSLDSTTLVRNENMYDAAIERIRLLTESIPPHHSIGVLVRTNEEVGELIFRLQQAKIPASEEGGNAITDSAAVELVLSAICLADHPGDDLARFHVSHSPLADEFGLKPEDQTTQAENKRRVAQGAADLRTRLVRQGYGPTVEALAKKLMPMCTRRELLRLHHLVRVAYASASDNERWGLRPKRFVDYVRDEVKVADQSGAQVRVMTIHKCKGLEFDSVVLPMKYVSNGWFGIQPKVVVGRDGPTEPVRIACRYVGEEIRNLLPANFQEMFEEDRKRTVREAMCVLYVALTRAVHSTHIVSSYSAKPNDKSAAGVLLAALEVERKPGIAFEHGDPRWFEKAPPVAAATGTEDLEPFYLPANSQPRCGAISTKVRSGRGLGSTSPSRLEGGELMQLGSLFETRDNDQNLLRGTMLHACFELVSWLDQARPDRADLVAHLRTINPTLDDCDRFAMEFESMLKHDAVARLLNYQTYLQDFAPDFAAGGAIMLEAHRLEVENERPFAVNLDGELFGGFIDRLVLVYEGDKLVAADVIDFKSDPVTVQSLGARIQFYRPQLNAYRRAVSKFTKLPADRISARLVFLEIGQVVIVDQGPPSPRTGPRQPQMLNRQQKSESRAAKPKPAIRSSHKKPARQQQKRLWDE
jgi:ATP-dependent exoDNAse (exonuclease V) beta subunit